MNKGTGTLGYIERTGTRLPEEEGEKSITTRGRCQCLREGGQSQRSDGRNWEECKS